MRFRERKEPSTDTTRIHGWFSTQPDGIHTFSTISQEPLSAPARLMRLLIASCLAYIWLVYLGVCALRDGWMKRLHREDRCDLSLFRLGVRLVARCLKDDIPLPEGFLVPVRLPGNTMRHSLNQAT